MRLIFASVVFSCLALPSHSAAQKYESIDGHVFYADEFHPAKDIVVNLLNSEHTLLTSIYTPESGEFRFLQLKPVNYYVTINVDRYESVSLNLDLSSTDAKGLAIYLHSLNTKQQQAPGGPTVSAHELSMPVKSRELVDSGKKKLYQDKNPPAAIADFQSALAAAPSYYEAAYQLGIAQLALSKAAEAESAFRDSFEQSGRTFGDASVRIGAILIDRGDLPAAEQAIRTGIKLNPNFWLGHYQLGRVLLAQKKLPDAATAADQARSLAPNYPMIYRLLSDIHLAQQNYPALLEDLNAYIAIDPDSPAGLRAKKLRDQTQARLSSQPATPAQPQPPQPAATHP